MFIPIVPSCLYSILEAPIPYIVGLNKNLEYDINEFFTMPDSAVVVSLDTSTISFTGIKQTVEDFPSLRICFNELSAYYNSKTITDHKELVKYICQTVKKTLKRSITNKLPTLSISRDIAETEIERIKTLIKQYILEEDKSFVSKFVETQIFVSYIEDRYMTTS